MGASLPDLAPSVSWLLPLLSAPVHLLPALVLVRATDTAFRVLALDAGLTHGGGGPGDD